MKFPRKEPFDKIVQFIRQLYPELNPIPLHAPIFSGNEKQYLIDCIDSTFVSYLGKYVTQFEQLTAQYTGAKHAIAMVNGTTALQIALQVAGVKLGDEVITQALTFVATPNAICHAGATPIFVDVDNDSMGMSPEKLESWIVENLAYDIATGKSINKRTKNAVTAIVPMHTLGHPCRIDEIVAIANKYSIPVIEDSAESLGSFYKNKHTGRFGLAGIFSYNGNKTITTGGGGIIITDDEDFAIYARHITTTAKVSHKWKFVHDVVGYNFRMPSVNAAVGVAQMELIDEYLEDKRATAELYNLFCVENEVKFIKEPDFSRSNYWLNSIIFKNCKERDDFLAFSNNSGVMTRPLWNLMHTLEIFKYCQHGELSRSEWLADRVVSIPSGVRKK